MTDITALEELNSKISLLLVKYDELKEENQKLKEALQTSHEAETQLRQELLKVKEEDELKNMELEDIVTRISATIGLEIEPNNIPMAS